MKKKESNRIDTKKMGEKTHFKGPKKLNLLNL